MIRIMILDDEAIYLEKERKITHSFFARKGIEHRIAETRVYDSSGACKYYFFS